MSLLGSTIEYVHKLRDRLKALQEEKRRQNIDLEDDEDENAVSLKIKVEVRGTTVRVMVICREKKGALIKVVTEIEKHGLFVANINVVPSAESLLNITIMAQVLRFLLLDISIYDKSELSYF